MPGSGGRDQDKDFFYVPKPPGRVSQHRQALEMLPEALSPVSPSQPLWRPTETASCLLWGPPTPPVSGAVPLETPGARAHRPLGDARRLSPDSRREDGEEVGLHKDNVLLRGCTVRNTEAVVGIVLYAGGLARPACMPCAPQRCSPALSVCLSAWKSSRCP